MKKTRKSLSSFTAARLRAARISSGMSQMQLAEKIGVSYQQIQKYENGKSELTVSRLRQFSEAFNLPPSYFLEDPSSPHTSEPEISYYELDKDEIRLISLLRKFGGRDLIKRLIDTVKSISRLKKP